MRSVIPVVTALVGLIAGVFLKSFAEDLYIFIKHSVLRRRLKISTSQATPDIRAGTWIGIAQIPQTVDIKFPIRIINRDQHEATLEQLDADLLIPEGIQFITKTGVNKPQTIPGHKTEIAELLIAVNYLQGNFNVSEEDLEKFSSYLSNLPAILMFHIRLKYTQSGHAYEVENKIGIEVKKILINLWLNHLSESSSSEETQKKYQDVINALKRSL